MQDAQRSRCGAKTRQGGKCTNPPVTGKTRCRMHGGARGSGRPIIHGRYSQAMKGTLRDAFHASLSDPSLLDARQTIAGMDALAKAQAERVEDGDGPTFRSRAIELLEKYRAENGKDNGNPVAALHALFDHLEDGGARAVAEMDLFEMYERIDKRVSDAVKNEHAKNVSVPMSRVADLLLGVLATGYRLLPEDKAREMEVELSKLFGMDPPPRQVEALTVRS